MVGSIAVDLRASRNSSSSSISVGARADETPRHRLVSLHQCQMHHIFRPSPASYHPIHASLFPAKVLSHNMDQLCHNLAFPVPLILLEARGATTHNMAGRLRRVTATLVTVPTLTGAGVGTEPRSHTRKPRSVSGRMCVPWRPRSIACTKKSPV